MDRREVVLEIIEKNPGIRFNEIMRISNIRNGTLSHYVKKLEEEESIELERTPRVTRLYPAGIQKKGGGKLIVKEVFNKIKKSNHLNRLVTLSPLTDMAYKFHIKNGAKLISVNETTQNFEYKII